MVAVVLFLMARFLTFVHDREENEVPTKHSPSSQSKAPEIHHLSN